MARKSGALTRLREIKDAEYLLPVMFFDLSA
jgi:hypothetical protein